jgi:hypothetical protein
MEIDGNLLDLDYKILIDRIYEKFLQGGGINKDNLKKLINQYNISNNKNGNENEVLKYLLDNTNKQQNIVLLGEFFRQGIGTEKDEIKAFEFHKAAAETGNIKSMYQLGEYHFYGIGTKKNVFKAIEFYKKAAEKDDINAINDLGYCYQHGIGTEKDEIKAFELYKGAAEKGHIISKNDLGYCYQHGIGTEKDEIKAFELYKELAEKGHIYSINELGYCYQHGIGTEKNETKALELYKVAEDRMDNSMTLAFSDQSSHTLKDITKLFGSSGEQIIKQFKLNHGIVLTGENIRPSIRAIIAEDGELKMNLYKGSPLVYTSINSKDYNYDGQLDTYINFPIAEIFYNGNLAKSFTKHNDNDEKLHESYGHFLARKFLVGGQLFIKNFNLAPSAQIDVLKFYLMYIYKSAKCSTKIQFNNLFDLSLLPKIVTVDGEELRTREKLTKWMNDLYQKKTITIISYDDLIPVTQLRQNILSLNNLELFNEKQPGVANFKKRLSLEEWIGDEVYDNLVNWTEDFHLFLGLIINDDYEIRVSRKIAVDFIEIPKVNLKKETYWRISKPSTNLETILISNNIFLSNNLCAFPFINYNNVKSYKGYNYIRLNYEQYEILLDKDHIKPTKEFERLIENALNSTKPLKTLQNIFNEYGHLFPQRIILGRSLENIIPEESTNSFNLESLPTFLLTQEGEVVEKSDIYNWIKNTNNNLEIIQFDNIIPLYKILEVEQQRKVDDILKNDSRIIMTGITDLKDLDNNNDVHYKRINLNPESVLEDEDYEVFGSIISEDNTKIEEIYVNFGLYDFSGFHAIIKKLEETSIDMTKCYVLWMIVGNPSKLSIFSPNNRDFQVNCIKVSVTLQAGESNYYIKTAPLQISQGYTTSVHAYYPSTNYEPINIFKIVEWNDEYMNFQMTYNKSNESNMVIFNDTQLDGSLTNTEIDLHVCFLSTTNKNLKIDYEERECSLDLIGYILTRENFNDKLLNKIESKARMINKDVLFNIFGELQDDPKLLFSCLMVNRLWCETAIPILWKNPWCYDINYSNKNYLFIIIASYLSDDIKEFLTRQGIKMPPVSCKLPLYDYLSFCRSINVNTISIITSIGSSLVYNQFLLQKEFFDLFMKKFPELRYLDMNSIKHQIFYFPKARLCLESLCELKCDTSIDSSYYYGLAQLCQFIQRIIIINVEPNNCHGIAKLIEVQKYLKYFEWKDDHDEVFVPGSDSYKEILLALEKSANVIKHLNTHFAFTSHTLQMVLPKLHKLKTLIAKFGSFSEKQLKKCIYHDLEIFKIDYYELKAASIIIENSGGHLKEILLKPYEIGNYIDNFIDDSLILIRKIRKNCPSIEYLSLTFSPSKEHFAELEKLLSNCRNLKSLLLDIFDHAHEKLTHEKILEYGEKLLKILISSTPIKIKEIRFCGDFEFSLEALEGFLEKWKGCALTILTSDNNYEEEDFKNLINEYKRSGVIKDFRYEHHINMDF